MTVHQIRKIQMAAGGALLVAAGAVTFVLGGILGVGGGGVVSGGPQGHAGPTGTTPEQDLPTPSGSLAGRTALICVDAVGTSSPLAGEQTIEEMAKVDVEAAANGGLSTEFWRPLGWSEVRVSTGCPSAPLPLTMGGKWAFGMPDRAPPSVESPSGYSLFIFVMPLEDIDALLGGTDIRRTSQEFQCIVDSCFPKSSAMYITPEEAAQGREFLRTVIEEGVGLSDR